MPYANPRFDDFWTFPIVVCIFLGALLVAFLQHQAALIATYHVLRSFLAAVDG